jgi:hypothetical protein
MMAMTISAFNERTTRQQGAAQAPTQQQRPAAPPIAAQPEKTAASGVRAPEREKGEVKDPTWKLQELLDKNDGQL